jgi:hypothetical protein
MRVARRLLSIASVIAAVLVLLFALLFAGQQGEDRTIEHNNTLLTSFKKAKSFAEEFKGRHHRLPSSEEFNAWSNSLPPVPYESPFGIRLIQNQLPATAANACGKPPADFYLLEYWRGEWFEYFCPWSESSTLQLSPKDFYLLGNKRADVLAFIGCAIAFASFGVLLWPKAHHSKVAP